MYVPEYNGLRVEVRVKQNAFHDAVARYKCNRAAIVYCCSLHQWSARAHNAVDVVVDVCKCTRSCTLYDASSIVFPAFLLMAFAHTHARHTCKSTRICTHQHQLLPILVNYMHRTHQSTNLVYQMQECTQLHLCIQRAPTLWQARTEPPRHHITSPLRRFCVCVCVCSCVRRLRVLHA